MVRAAISGFGSSVPSSVGQRALWEEVFADRFASVPRARAIWRAAGVSARGRVADPRAEDLRDWGTGARMRRFVEEAMPLGKEAIGRCLGSAGVRPDAIDAFTVVSCTGYATPGIDVLLARDLGMRPDVERLHVGHMGCHAALPAISAAADAARARGLATLVLCVELPSLHVQPHAQDTEQVVTHALFGDAAAACLVSPTSPGLEFVSSRSRTAPEAAAMMTWEVTDTGFRMGLAPEVPDALAPLLGPLLDELLGPEGLSAADISGWAVHPGGPRILTVTERTLGLAPEALAASRGVLRSCGNASSATVLLILERMLREDPPAAGEHLVALAFGPGLTLVATLLRATARPARRASE